MRCPPILLIAPLFFATIANAQSNNITQVQHVIVIIQENRTPTNLFGGDTALVTAGAHLPTTGSCHGTSITLAPFQLDACFDNDHSHSPAWLSAYDSTSTTHMDGDCDVKATLESGLTPTCASKVNSLPCPKGAGAQYCTGYTYVSTAPNSKGYVLVQPYYDIAKNWGFANYMFQTNQGPSFPAHQFLFSGTSSPVYPTNTYYDWFAGENLGTGGHNGCLADANAVVMDVSPTDGSESAAYNPNYSPPANTLGFPCYDHNTLTDVLNASSISWKYYSDGSSKDPVPYSSLWTAPNAIQHICMPTLGNSNTCGGPAFQTGGQVVNDLQIFTDLGANPKNVGCTLPQVSWVIPDGNWSDHPGTEGHDGGPSWVAAIVNAVGGYDNSGALLAKQCGYWANTVILITWDDWGGFYDDVNPIATMSASNGGKGGYPGTSNGTYYVYGFRVPLLVVSSFARPGFVSGAGVSSPHCPNLYCHDFGSILNFIEYAFGTGGNSLGPIGPSSWPYADSFAQDVGQPPNNNFALHDFFNFTMPHKFIPITSAEYMTSCFITRASALSCFPKYPTPPDTD